MDPLLSRFGSRSLLDPHPQANISAEHCRLDNCDQCREDWKRWGPYVSDRQWGTCREDYGLDGNSWEYVPFHTAHQVAYRWGEDGIAGFCDSEQRLCVSLAMWNGHDPILKERLFGLGGPQGNHGEDVKEIYHYLDATPSHSYLKMLYKYPQKQFPYDDIREKNAALSSIDPEYELMDTGIFDDDRYFDIYVEYARAGVDDILLSVTALNRGPEAAEIHLLPQAFFRNTWTWGEEGERPSLELLDAGHVLARHPTLGQLHLFYDSAAQPLFCENETNAEAVCGEDDGLRPFRHLVEATRMGKEQDTGAEGSKVVTAAGSAARGLYHASGCRSAGPYKDAFHAFVIKGDARAAGLKTGTKSAYYTRHTVPAAGSTIVRLRITLECPDDPFAEFHSVLEERKREADAFYNILQADITDPEHQRIQRQALAGMIWSKQFYYFDIHTFFEGDPECPKPPAIRRAIRNSDWDHMCNKDIISMPDKWEFPWYATWDLAFHCLPLALLDASFAKAQLLLMTREWYMHPNGQLPAFEWNFSDVNPPVHAWASWRVFQMDRKQRNDQGDLSFLEEVFHKLMINFTWWVNRKDAEGRNIFQGGFLGLDNIGVFDRCGELPTGGFINQSDGTSWMAFFSLSLMRIALELALHNPVYESIAAKFFEHFLHIARAMTLVNSGHGLWDEEDGFYYDVLTMPDGDRVPLKVRSLVGLIPLFAVEVLEPFILEKLPRFAARAQWLFDNRDDLSSLVSHFKVPGRGERRLLSLLKGPRMNQLLRRMLDPSEFLSEYGIRALSRHHLENPYVLEREGKTYAIGYEPGEAQVKIMGGNSNWRGPIWFPMNYLIIESLQKFYQYYGNEYKIECPTGSGQQMSILEVAEMLSARLVALFEPGKDGGGRPAMRLHPKLATDPHFRDNLLFYEHFHGDDGRGVGASHQTGWTGLVAKLIQARAAVAGLPAGDLSPSFDRQLSV